MPEKKGGRVDRGGLTRKGLEGEELEGEGLEAKGEIGGGHTQHTIRAEEINKKITLTQKPLILSSHPRNSLTSASADTDTMY